MNATFYADLPAFDHFPEFSNSSHYTPLPDDWTVVITDVQGSTRAIEQGRYKDVNTLGAASIMAVLNAVKPLKIPFVFGGDGALLCVPTSFVERIQGALIGAKEMAEKSFNLSLRTGLVDMKEIKSSGRTIAIGKFRPLPHYEQAMFMGNGLEYAESLVKSPAPNSYLLADNACSPNADFSGFECRWHEVKSPHEETLAVLISARPADAAAATRLYADVLNDFFEIYGEEADHHPIRQNHLRTALSPFALKQEIRLKGWRHAAAITFYSWIGRWLMWKKVKTSSTDWGLYKQRLILNTDFRKFDGALRMIVSGTRDQSRRLREMLERRRREGELVFGLHVNPGAIITCLVSDYELNHVHFVDGSAGGYALAAKELKEQLRSKI